MTVTHRIRYSAELEKTDVYTIQYEEYWCGLTKRFVKDEPLTEEEARKVERMKQKFERNFPTVCKKCDRAFEKMRGG